MNCEKGDLAIIVRSWAGNEGKIVRCLSLNEERSTWFGQHGDGRITPPEPIWNIDQELPSDAGIFDSYIADSQLRPIRDPGDDAVDETLLRLPSPRQEVTA